MPAKRKPRSSAQILKRSLGRDKTLLDSLPLDKVDFKQNEAPALDGGYHEHILHLGHILNESGVRHELFAYLTLSTEQEVLPEIHYYGCDPSDKLLRSFKAQDVVAKGSIREEFRLGLKTAHEFSTLLKVGAHHASMASQLTDGVSHVSSSVHVVPHCQRTSTSRPPFYLSYAAFAADIKTTMQMMRANRLLFNIHPLKSERPFKRLWQSNQAHESLNSTACLIPALMRCMPNPF